MLSDIDRHKKARQVFTLRAFRTLLHGSGDHQPRILVELAGVEPASEIPTYHFYCNENSNLRLKTMFWCYLMFARFMHF